MIEAVVVGVLMRVVGSLRTTVCAATTGLERLPSAV